MVCSRNVVIKPDVAFTDAVKKDYDVVICPGGLKGAEHLASVSDYYFSCVLIMLVNIGAFVMPPYVIGQAIIFLPWFLLLTSFFPLPNLNQCRLDVYHAFTHGVALVQI